MTDFGRRTALYLVALMCPLYSQAQQGSHGAVPGAALRATPSSGARAVQHVEDGVPWDRASSERRHPASGSGCTLEWVPTFGAGSAVNGSVLALAVFDDESGPALHVGGTFTEAGGQVVNRIAKWTGSAWSPLGSGVSGGTCGPVVSVNALAVFDDGTGDALYAGGAFASAGGHASPGIAKWVGSAWASVVGGIGGEGGCFRVSALEVFDDGTGDALYVGGSFSHAGGGEVFNIAKWDGQSWSSLGSGLAGSALFTLKVFDDGSGDALYAAGTSNRVHRWDGSNWGTLPGVFGSPGPPIYVLQAFDDGSGAALYAGGGFTSVDGLAANYIARWNGPAWSAVGSGMDGPVQALVEFDDGSGSALYAGGHFTNAGGQAANRLARWDGSAWSSLGDTSPFGVAADVSVRSLASFDDGAGDALYVGGNFTDSPAGDSYIAKWGCAAPPATAFCLGDGSASPCPCGNVNDGSAGLPAGCANSNNRGGGALSASGSSSVALDDLVLRGSNLAPGQAALYFQGDSAGNGGQSNPLGDGLLCVAGSVVRLEIRTGDANGASQTTVDLAAVGGASAGDLRFYQCWYRNTITSPCGAGFNLTNALEITWAP